MNKSYHLTVQEAKEILGLEAGKAGKVQQLILTWTVEEDESWARFRCKVRKPAYAALFLPTLLLEFLSPAWNDGIKNMSFPEREIDCVTVWNDSERWERWQVLKKEKGEKV